MARLLVTGASGLLGANLVLEASAEHEVIGVARHHLVEAPGVRGLTADLTEAGAARRLLREIGPEWVVHCAAATDVDRCQADPEWAMRLNRDMAGEVAAAAREVGAALVYVSTDAVFDGERGGYREADPPRPISAYGSSKAAGEEIVLRAHPQAVVVRTNIFGWNALPKLNLAEWFLERCRRGQTSPGWTDVASTPILCNDLADLLLQLLRHGAQGILHVGGATCLSKHDFGRRVAETFGFDPDLIRPAVVADAGLPARRGRNLCLQSDRAAALDLHLPDLDDGLRRFLRMQQDGSAERLRRLVSRTEPAATTHGLKETKR